MDSPSRRVVINVGGVRFETYASTLLIFPSTKLATLAEVNPSEASNYDPQRNEFFFDRNPKVFGYILDYHRTKHLHCSDNICRAMLMAELAFWEVSFTQLSHCCWLKINTNFQAVEDFASWNESVQNDEQLLLETDREDRSWRERWQPKVWNLFQMPYSSLTAMCVAAISLLFIIGVIVIFFEGTKQHYTYMLNSSEYGSYNSFHKQMDPLLLYLELVCVLCFVFEFCTRFFFCPSRTEFLKSPLNWVDFFSLFPVFVELMFKDHAGESEIAWKILGLIRIVYIMKLFRLVMLMEGSLVLRVLSGTLRAITREIFILLLILALETLLFATLAFYAEWSFIEISKDRHEFFENIYSCCWWAIITLTTVGYGDMYPITTAGRIVCSLAAISGVLTIVLPIPILMIKFQHYYSIALAKERRKLQQKM